ncbi:MAG: CPBP family intramembrane metalloprotease [Anaerolineaceae bacterium]|nr:CPBP family intramembrane metalloprotease [Anaerolineaceae bacterium]
MNKIISYILPFITVAFGIYIAKNVWVSMLGYHFFAILILVGNKQGYQLKRLFSGGSFNVVLMVGLVTAFSGVVLYYSGSIVNLPTDFGVLLASMGLTHNTWWIFILYYSFINPIIEEIYWRGYLGSDTKKLTFSDFCYAGYHPLVFIRFVDWPWAIIEFFALLAVAWLWRMLVKKYDGLLLPLVMHFSADIGIVIAIFFLAK